MRFSVLLAGFGVALGVAFWDALTALAAALADAITLARPIIAGVVAAILAACVVGLARGVTAFGDWVRWRAAKGALVEAPRGVIHVDDVRTPTVLAASVRRMDADGVASIADAWARGVVSIAARRIHASDPPTALRDERPPPVIPATADLVREGVIGAFAPLALGFNPQTGAPVYGTLGDLYSTGVGGLPGSGKTWGVSFLLAQSAAHGARLIICDPHAGDAESLAARCAGLRASHLCEPAEDPRDILTALRLARDALMSRKRGDRDRTPIIVAIDEWTALYRALGDDAAMIIESIVLEGRKLGVFALLAAQLWTKDAAGAFRNALASSYVYRQRKPEAGYLTGLSSAVIPDDVQTLPPGVAYLVPTAGLPQRIVIPRTTEADIAELGRQASASLPPPGAGGGAEGDGKPSGSRAEDAQEEASRASGSDELLSAEDARFVAAFRDGKTIPEIIRDVLNVSSTGGRAYQEARARVEDAIRRALKGERP
jgi:hypothetical protein